MVVKCEYCGKEFEKPTNKVNESLKNGWKLFCSDECHKKSKTKKIKCNCANCGKELFKTPAELKRSKTGNVFCNRSCACSYNNSHFRSGENNPNWKGGKFNGSEHCKIAYRNYKSFCAVCNCNDPDVLEVHHIDLNHKNNDLNNLIILCANHHSKVHRGNLKITKEIKNNRQLLN